jgi:protein-S-isoprenylcysteine O-methyltransferase Ste14
MQHIRHPFLSIILLLLVEVEVLVAALAAVVAQVGFVLLLLRQAAVEHLSLRSL